MDERWKDDCECSETELKDVAYTVLSLLGGLITLGVGLFMGLLIMLD